MPELPDIVVYLEALAPRVLHQVLERLRIANPFLVRTPFPPVTAAEGRRVVSLSRMGKRIVFGMEGDLSLVLHLMIAGRLRWRDRGAQIPGKVGLAAFDFPTGSAILTEAGSKRQASSSDRLPVSFIGDKCAAVALKRADGNHEGREEAKARRGTKTASFFKEKNSSFVSPSRPSLLRLFAVAPQAPWTESQHDGGCR